MMIDTHVPNQAPAAVDGMGEGLWDKEGGLSG